MENNKTTLEQSQKTLLQFLLAKKKPILIITFLVAIGAIIASLLMTPLYLSSAIVFPAATSSVWIDRHNKIVLPLQNIE